MPESAPQETSKAAYAFNMYCAMGYDRSLPKLAEKLGHKPVYARTLQSWAVKYEWNRRIKEYDATLIQTEADEERLRLREKVIAMNDEHARVGREQLQKAVDIINKLAEAEEISASVAVQLLKAAADLERQALGEGILQKLQLTGADSGPVVIETVWGTPKVEEAPIA